MLNQRQRPVVVALAVVASIWIAAFAGYAIVKNARVTPEKVRTYASALDLSHMSAAERSAAIMKLAAMINALSFEDRQKLQMEGAPHRLFDQMTEEEKGQFLAATMPTGFKQMIGAFEVLPEDQRRRTVDMALKNLRESRSRLPGAGTNSASSTNQMILSPELRDQVTKMGLKSFYSESSPQTKAELAPLLEEMQKTMQSGKMLRHEPRQ